MAFPGSPTNGQAYKNKIYRSSTGAWVDNFLNSPSESELGFHIIPEASRPTAWANAILNGGSATSWTDLNCSSKIPSGTKAVLVWGSLHAQASVAGYSYTIASIRKNGTSATANAPDSVYLSGIEINPSVLNTNYTNTGLAIVEVDESGIFEYVLTNSNVTSVSLYIALYGYYI